MNNSVLAYFLYMMVFFFGGLIAFRIVWALFIKGLELILSLFK